MTPIELDNAQRWARRLEPGAEVRTTIGPNGRAWKVQRYEPADGFLYITRTPGRRLQYKTLHGDSLIAAYKASSKPIGVKAPPRLRYIG